MQTFSIIKTSVRVWFYAAMLMAADLTAEAQKTSWATTASGDWNTATRWNPAIVPIETTNASIANSATFTVAYNSPMVASSIGSLTLGVPGISSSVPTLTIAAAGFNVTGLTLMTGLSAEVININSGGVMTNGTLDMVSLNGSVNVSGVLTNGATKVGDVAFDGASTLNINLGAVASLGDVTIGRNSPSTTLGLVITGGSVSANSIDVGNRNSYATMAVSGGTVTNAGNLRLGTGVTTISPQHEVRYHQTGGTVGVAGTVDLPVATNYTTSFSVLGAGSTFYAQGVRLFPNALASASTALFTNSGTIYLGAAGFNALNSGAYTVILNDQGTLGAAADWSGNVNFTASNGTFTFKAADSADAAHNIVLTNIISGAGGVAKTGAGTLALFGANTFSGSTAVNAGTLLVNNLTGSGTGSGTVSVQSGAILGGTGIISGATTVNAGGALAPGVGGIGTLTFATSPAVSGTNLMEIDRNSGTPLADKVAVTTGALTKSGILTVSNLGAALQSGDTFTLFAAPSITGTFSATNLPALSAGQNWWTTDNFTTLTVNQVNAGTANYTRAKGTSLKIAISDLLTNVTSLPAGGDTFAFTGVGASTNGATIATNGTYIFYTPANNNNESFSYSVADGRGGSATGWINLTVISAVGPAQIAGAPVNGVATIKFFGLPSYTYVVQTTTNLGTPWWNLVTNTTGTNGLFIYTDAHATNGSQYYRLSQP